MESISKVLPLYVGKKIRIFSDALRGFPACSCNCCIWARVSGELVDSCKGNMGEDSVGNWMYMKFWVYLRDDQC